MESYYTWDEVKQTEFEIRVRRYEKRLEFKVRVTSLRNIKESIKSIVFRPKTSKLLITWDGDIDVTTEQFKTFREELAEVLNNA